ncbi:glycosyltransferase family 2 protein [Lichenifustis flavocetrariae]|uniref:Glycosyltransferase family 2 protein n=1 Tax=Lichenifustis flavocetrariae TaxID=2949735 RepID=A0AA42CIX9_9HYPH|nr:glycosyltransferase family A protein [Lichenifustis flavocetrariae]MCW6507366.1 glycosyltransferase family 2 protein [Lichenifustis flavocetrariae]
MAAPLTISIIITNYNYAAYLGQCLDSIVTQTYAQVECIVVDDGSTDASRDIIARYPTVKSVFQVNAGQAAATRTGFALATGDVVVFLDADDFLLPDACAEIARVWTPDLVAFHYRLQIFRNGEFEHRYWPDDVFCQEGQQLESLFERGYVPAAPNSGNAYARSYVETVFREATSLGYHSIDACLAYSAPVVGRTRHSERALGAYRVHDSNLTIYNARKPVSRARMHLYYSYHAQATARKLAAARDMVLPRWAYLDGAYELKLYLTLRGSAITSLGLPEAPALACATRAARTFLSMPRLSLKRRLANVAIVFGLVAAPPWVRRKIGERFYNLDFAL